MKPKKQIRFAIDTIEDMMFNDHILTMFGVYQQLIQDGHVLAFYRLGDDENRLTLIKDLDHLQNFKRSFKFIT